MTKEKLLNYLSYNSYCGDFVWRDHWHPTSRTRFVGKIAGGLNGNGYHSICVAGKRFYVHQLVWFVEKGTWAKLIDHINGNVTDNRIENLREASIRSNQQNKTIHRNGKLVGCSFDKKRGVWMSQIFINGKNRYLGSYPTELKAHQVYMKKLKEVSL